LRGVLLGLLRLRPVQQRGERNLGIRASLKFWNTKRRWGMNGVARAHRYVPLLSPLFLNTSPPSLNYFFLTDRRGRLSRSFREWKGRICVCRQRRLLVLVWRAEGTSVGCGSRKTLTPITDYGCIKPNDPCRTIMMFVFEVGGRICRC